MSDGPGNICDILSALVRLGQNKDSVTIGDVVGQFGQRGYGPFLLVPALVGMSPVGGIPGVPTFLALVVALFAAQILIGRRNLWLPALIRERSLPGRKLANAVGKLSGIGRFLDRLFYGRLAWLTGEPVPRIAAAVILALCCLIPPLEIVPLAVAVPMAVVAGFGIALLVKDGLLMLAALGGSGAAAALAASMLLGGSGAA